MEYSIMLGDRLVFYELTRKKVKNINLRIYPDGKIKISANPRVPIKTVEGFILSRSEFILRALKGFESREVRLGKTYENNDSVRIFGEILTLKVFREKKNHVALSDGELCLYVNDENDCAIKEKTLEKYLKKELEDEINATLPEIFSLFSEYNIKMPEIKLRKMKTRWGSCNCSKGIVTFSIALAEHSRECIAFVIAHELCHLVHPNHSSDFYATLSSVMPDWKIRKNKLNNK